MTPEKLAKRLVENNTKTIYKSGGINDMFISLFASIIDVDILMDTNKDDDELFSSYFQSKCILIDELEKFCLDHKDALILSILKKEKLNP